MRKYLVLLFVFFSVCAYSQIKLIQLQPCKVGGVLEDSCFVMTGADGLLKFISLSQLKTITGGGGTITANPDGSYTFVGDNTTTLKYTCSVVQDTVIRIFNNQGNLASSCTVTGLGAAFKSVSINSDTTLSFMNKAGQIFTVNMCPFVRNCETVTELTYNITNNNLTYVDENGISNLINLNESTLVNNVNGSYTHTNEIGTVAILGYKLVCVNDSTIQLTDNDGTVVSTCSVQGGTGTSETITDLFNNADGSYTYRNELGIDTLLGYHFDVDSINVHGYMYLTDLDGTKIDSVSLCDPPCPPLNATAKNDTFSLTDCKEYTGDVSTNDISCNKGISEYSTVLGTEQNVLISMDAAGKFVASFTTCEAGKTYKFSYRMKCKDGTVSYADVIFNIPNCSGAVANLDSYSGTKGGSISFGVAPNDVACGGTKTTTYKVTKSTNSGSIFINDNGTGIYSPLPTFTGTDSAIIGIYCNGVLCDTSFIKFTIVAGSSFGSMQDDYISIAAGATINGNNASSNDTPCGAGVTTYTWLGSVFPTVSINFTGANPTNFGITAVKTFCGVAHRFYTKNCDGVPVDTATVFIYVTCGNAVNDIVGALDTIVSGNVYQNDDVCTNGGLTTWHLLTDSTAHGTGLNITVYECFADCPNVTPIIGAKVTAWDSTTGVFTVKLPNGFEGEACFKYRLKCKLGGTKMYDTACVKIVRELTPTLTLVTEVEDTLLSDISFSMSAKCFDGFNNAKPLENGDEIIMRISSLQGWVSVKLKVGQPIKNVSGYSADSAGRYASWVVPAIQGNPILDRLMLFDSTMKFKINKAVFSQLSDNWGDGTVAVNKIGHDQIVYMGVCCGTCSSGGFGTDTMPKMWSMIDLHQWCEKIPPCANLDPHLRSLVGQTAFLTVPNGAAATFFSNHEYRCDTTSAFVASGVSGEIPFYPYHKSAVACNTCPTDDRNSFTEYKTYYINSPTYYKNVTVEPLQMDYDASIQRHKHTVINGNNQVRLTALFNKHHHSTGVGLSVLRPQTRWYATYTNNPLAREEGVTVTQIEFRVAKNHGDRAYIIGESDRVILTNSISQNSIPSVTITGSGNLWTFAHGEGYYHHWGYMDASNGKRYSITNGQVILFSY